MGLAFHPHVMHPYACPLGSWFHRHHWSVKQALPAAVLWLLRLLDAGVAPECGATRAPQPPEPPSSGSIARRRARQVPRHRVCTPASDCGHAGTATFAATAPVSSKMEPRRPPLCILLWLGPYHALYHRWFPRTVTPATIVGQARANAY